MPPSPFAAAELQAVFAALPRRTVPDLRNVCIIEQLYGAALRVDDVDLTARTVTVRDLRLVPWRQAEDYTKAMPDIVVDTNPAR